MKTPILPIVIALLGTFLNGCDQKPATQSNEGQTTTARSDSSFARLADEFLAGYLAWRPQTGTYLGLHQYDGKVTDFGKTSLEAELTRLKKYDRQLAATDTTALGVQEFYDYRLLQSAIRAEIFEFENLGYYSRNPMNYAGVLDLNIYVQRDFAPLAERMRSIIAIEERAPDLFAAARENLADSLARPYVETAIQIARGSADFLGKELAGALRGVKDDSLQAAFAVSNQKAITELNGFATYLEKEKLPKAHARYAIGRENYQKMLLYNEMLTLSPEQVLEMGLAELKREQTRFAEVARKIDPSLEAVDVFDALKKEHPTAENLLPEARKNLEAIRQFLIDKQILTIPSEVRVNVQETPSTPAPPAPLQWTRPARSRKRRPRPFTTLPPSKRTGPPSRRKSGFHNSATT
ncbi:MAG: DUF885 family protein [Ferruginibacter sp.]|nr:DUF885 family protein [Cytophagales bacterium]